MNVLFLFYIQTGKSCAQAYILATINQFDRQKISSPKLGSNVSQ